jgi:NAD-reducing hydrogenase small subunit
MNAAPGARKKLRVATTSLAGCFGCHMSFLDIDERLLEAARTGRVRPLAAHRHQALRPCDIGLIEGGLCNAENVHVLREFRRPLQDPGGRGRLRHQRRPAGAAQPPRPADMPAKRCTRPNTGVANGSIPNDPELPLPLNKVHPIHEVVRSTTSCPAARRRPMPSGNC